MNAISRPATLWFLLATTLALTYYFTTVTPAAGGVLLDSIWSPGDALCELAMMSAVEKATHLRVTLIYDTLYPISYVLLLIGTTWRFGGRFRHWLIWPAITAGTLDLIENASQALALSGNPSLLFLKAFATPGKFVCVGVAMVLAIVTVATAIARRLRKPGAIQSGSG